MNMVSVEPIKLNVTIKNKLEGSNGKFVAFEVTIGSNTFTYAVPYDSNMYGAIKSKVVSEYYSKKLGEVIVDESNL